MCAVSLVSIIAGTLFYSFNAWKTEKNTLQTSQSLSFSTIANFDEELPIAQQVHLWMSVSQGSLAPLLPPSQVSDNQARIGATRFPNVFKTLSMLNDLQSFTRVIALILLIVYLPIYSILTYYYGTHEFEVY